MKKILIGRGAGNDIRLKDDTDRVSRRQAVIEVSPLGKMRIHDTSSNGTFVNGERVEKPGGRELKRGDKVDFAHVLELDWSLVKDPYKGMKIALAALAVIVVAGAAVLTIYSDEIFRSARPQQEDVILAEEENVVDTPVDEAPADSIAPAQQPAKTATKARKRPKSPKNPAVKADPKDAAKSGMNAMKPEASPLKDGGDPALRPDMSPNNGSSLKSAKE
ncbi:MAG: FHA domain-containing protein [Muribaculaceae bacterium]|nr:FHA domain-containing protein [Muribaculaceae bacterium]